MSKNTLVTILAVIGGLVVLGWFLKLSFKLLGVLIGVGLVLLVLGGANKLIGGGK